jgi:tetrahydromethanopterin S-methyltransferase subunit D
MNKFILRLVFCVFGFVLSAACFAQDTKPEMADTMRANGKIYVVVAVCLTILIGLFIYVFLLDRKISRLEKGKD